MLSPATRHTTLQHTTVDPCFDLSFHLFDHVRHTQGTERKKEIMKLGEKESRKKEQNKHANKQESSSQHHFASSLCVL